MTASEIRWNAKPATGMVGYVAYLLKTTQILNNIDPGGRVNWPIS